MHSIEDVISTLEQYHQQHDKLRGKMDFAVKSINFYKETNLNTSASFYFTRVSVTRSGETRASVDLRLGLEDGTVIDTSWADSAGESSSVFEFKTGSPPEYAQLDPWDKIPNDSNYSNNSLMVEDFLLPVIKWINRVFDFVQNILLSAGAIV
ncbi:MAG TPA: hypothetical protein VLX91_14480 [Candidatus Acidoferrales bacterium]|nr:hypothetical protein [Candidatus Acidoferrales bacterium]